MGAGLSVISFNLIQIRITFKNKQFQSYCKVKILLSFQPYFIFNINIVVISAIEIVFAAITGMLEIIKPYVNQHIKPASVITSIVRERSFVCFVLIVFIAWGKKANVVRVPAVNPIIIAIISKDY